MKLLITGGAGYIGSFMVRALLENGHDVTAFDSLERGHREAVDSRAKFVQGDIKNRASLETLFSNESFNAVIHFAAYLSVEESEKKPEVYYQNNVVGSQNLFDSAINTGKVRNFIFSSSAAVYGNPIKIPIPEDHPKNPTSEYGKNKLATEEILESLRSENKDVSFAALRYFNAAGAALDSSNGENHDPETHIIPLAIRAILNDSEFKLYGTDYDTPDGTCVRDYIHVLDLVDAHILALSKIQKNPGGYYYNVGMGSGYSNREVIEMVEKETGRKIKIQEAERRSGDADQLVADPTKINTELGFAPKYSDLETIVESAWKWHNRNSKFKMTRMLRGLLLGLLLVLAYSKVILAESSYVLPYPSAMPGSIFYTLNLIQEEVLKFWYFGDFGQFNYNLKQSDKYLVESKTLFDYKQYLLGYQALMKSSDFFKKIKPALISANRHGKNIGDKTEILKIASEKHIEELVKMKSSVPEKFSWTSEKKSPSQFYLWQKIDEAVLIRKNI